MSPKPPSIPSKAFSAMNGEEIIQIALKKFEEKLRADDSFLPHLTYPVFEMNGTFTLRFYPSRNDGDRVKVEVHERVQSPGAVPQAGGLWTPPACEARPATP